MGPAMVFLLGVLVWGSFSGFFDRYFAPPALDALDIRSQVREAAMDDLAIPKEVRDTQAIEQLVDQLLSPRE
jgi:hypothetical protein